ncbi:hypothetical protein GCM10025866_07340 [Naasia aerilata]|uniref:Uncharacterized protein n=1 Tax=Naasia aerilata TaxID=1162966 RepID=A0ABM8G9E8_9MICO|nr:hypothetical protein GCM10025866_07340 [Naasia aerilata]
MSEAHDDADAGSVDLGENGAQVLRCRRCHRRQAVAGLQREEEDSSVRPHLFRSRPEVRDFLGAEWEGAEADGDRRGPAEPFGVLRDAVGRPVEAHPQEGSRAGHERRGVGHGADRRRLCSRPAGCGRLSTGLTRAAREREGECHGRGAQPPADGCGRGGGTHGT